MQRNIQRKKLTSECCRYETLWTESKLNSRISLPLALLLVLSAAIPSGARKKDTVAYGEGLIVNVPLPEPEVARVVGDIAANGIIRGTKEYNKDEFVSGAQPETSSAVFPEWKQGGQVFYKVRTGALDPRGFKDSNDIGTLAVRYIVQPQGAKNTVLRIDALFKEDFKHVVHLSDGSVESNEYRDIQDHLDFLELMEKEDAEAKATNNRERQEQLAAKQNPAAPTPAPRVVPESSSRAPESSSALSTSTVTQTADSSAASVQVTKASAPEPAPVPVETSSANVSATVQSAVESTPVSTGPPPEPAQTLEQRVKELRSEVQRVVKSPGAPLKSAPFHTALNLQSLPAGTQVLIVISTPYWYGVETHEGQHGWIMRDQLEQP